MRDADLRTEPAFTMIELVVAMVLLAIAVGLVGSALVQALSGSASSTSGAASDTAIARVTARFQDDLAVAQTADRAARLVREQAVLDQAVRTGGDAASDNPLVPKSAVDMEDVLLAEPDRFRIQADVDRTRDGAECVTWEMVPDGNELHLVRTTQQAGCGGQLEREVLMEMRTDAANALTEPFSYDLVCNRSLCGAGSQAPATAPCSAWSVPSVGDQRERRWIVGVRASFVTHAGRDATSSSTSTKMSIRSRNEHMWRTALGC